MKGINIFKSHSLSNWFGQISLQWQNEWLIFICLFYIMKYIYIIDELNKHLCYAWIWSFTHSCNTYTALLAKKKLVVELWCSSHLVAGDVYLNEISTTRLIYNSTKQSFWSVVEISTNHRSGFHGNNHFKYCVGTVSLISWTWNFISHFYYVEYDLFNKNKLYTFVVLIMFLISHYWGVCWHSEVTYDHVIVTNKMCIHSTVQLIMLRL